MGEDGVPVLGRREGGLFPDGKAFRVLCIGWAGEGIGCGDGEGFEYGSVGGAVEVSQADVGIVKRLETRRAYHESPGQATTALCASKSCEQDVSVSTRLSSTDCGTMASERPREYNARVTKRYFMLSIEERSK